MMKRIDLFVVTVCLLVQVSNADFVVRTDFDGGSARILDVDVSQGKVRFMPGGDANRGWTCWWAMRIDGLEVGQQFFLELLPSDQPTRNQGKLTDKPLAASWAMPSRASISHDGRVWEHTEPGKLDGERITYRATARAQTLWIAWGPLFTQRHARELIEQAKSRMPESRSFELARSREDRPVLAWSSVSERADQKKSGVWIQARQHAWESGSSWVAQGFVDWLCELNDDAKRLMESAEIIVVPIMDVDNVATGNGGKEANPRDHNRDWDSDPVHPEVAAAQARLLAWAADSKLDVFIDLHNPAPGDKQPFFFRGPPEMLSELARDNQTLFFHIAHRHINGPLPVKETPKLTGPSYHPLWRQISGQWVNDHGNSHTLSTCLETSWNTAESTTEGYRQVGRQLGAAVAEYLKRRRR